MVSIYKIPYPILRFICVYTSWTLIHSISIYLYQYLCAYPSIKGLLYSLLFVNSPHCQALHYLSNTSVFFMRSFWISLSLWFTQELFLRFPELKNKPSTTAT